MTQAETNAADIVVEEIFPHAPETIWGTMSSGEHMSRWLMKSAGFESVKGARFTLYTTPAGAWDGVIHCEVLEVVPNERLAFTWRGGHDDNNAQYGSRIDTIVTFTLTKVDGGTRLRVVHSGFVMPKNETSIRNLGGGWKIVVGNIGTMSGGRAD